MGDGSGGRIAGYVLPVGGGAREYVDRHLGHASLPRWHAAAGEDPDAYALDLPSEPWRPAG